MIQQLKDHNRFQLSVLLAVLTFFCFGLSLFRIEVSETRHFIFLNWNLFLAFVPWVMTTLLVVNPRLQQSKLLVGLVIGIWLVFFPNAPYILTDLFHLNPNSSMPIWFDLVLILSYAWTGLLYGFISLWDLEAILSRYLSNRWITVISITCMFLGSFGIYLGRFLRWNSWDLMNHPNRLLADVADRFANPFDHPRTWGVTIFLGLFLTMMYVTFKFLRLRPMLNDK